jgi:hypothetical protein
MNKLVLGLVITAAFFAGSIMTGTVADAAKDAGTDPVADAIDALTIVMSDATAIAGPQGDKGDTGDTGPVGPDALTALGCAQGEVAIVDGGTWVCYDADNIWIGNALPLGSTLSCGSGQFVTGITAGGNVVCGDPNP